MPATTGSIRDRLDSRTAVVNRSGAIRMERTWSKARLSKMVTTETTVLQRIANPFKVNSAQSSELNLILLCYLIARMVKCRTDKLAISLTVYT